MEPIFFNPWIWVIPIILLVLVVALMLGIRAVREDDLSLGGVMSTVFSGLGLLVLVPFYFGFMLPPYDASFYQTYRVAGELTTLEAAFNGDEGTMSQTFVSTVEGVDYFINSTDQRFRSLSVGDDVSLVCVKGFDYFVEPWLDCRFAG